jgi:hypothetical protein
MKLGSVMLISRSCRHVEGSKPMMVVKHGVKIIGFSNTPAHLPRRRIGAVCAKPFQFPLRSGTLPWARLCWTMRLAMRSGWTKDGAIFRMIGCICERSCPKNELAQTGSSYGCHAIGTLIYNIFYDAGHAFGATRPKGKLE